VKDTVPVQPPLETTFQPGVGVVLRTEEGRLEGPNRERTAANMTRAQYTEFLDTLGDPKKGQGFEDDIASEDATQIAQTPKSNTENIDGPNEPEKQIETEENPQSPSQLIEENGPCSPTQIFNKSILSSANWGANENVGKIKKRKKKNFTSPKRRKEAVGRVPRMPRQREHAPPQMLGTGELPATLAKSRLGAPKFGDISGHGLHQVHQKAQNNQPFSIFKEKNSYQYPREFRKAKKQSKITSTKLASTFLQKMSTPQTKQQRLQSST